MESQKYNILYGQLSQEDERQGESNSIHNQKLFLQRYADENGFDNTLFLADDGYSGTNFDWPAWKKIVETIENGEMETLIVKELSRLGWEYLQVGQLTELYFPEKGVRFIAVNDSVDSLVESSNGQRAPRQGHQKKGTLHQKNTGGAREAAWFQTALWLPEKGRTIQRDYTGRGDCPCGMPDLRAMRCRERAQPDR